MINSTYIIAEAGVNHNGDIKLAKQLIDVAADAGADAVKFQTFTADSLVTRTAKKADYQNRNTDSSESQNQMLRKLELSKDIHQELIVHCAKRNIIFLSTCFDIQNVDLLMSLGQNLFKIPSGEITNLPYLRHIGQLNKSVILSTGMSTMGDIESAISVLELAGTAKKNITILHCTSDYPTPMTDVNLLAMKNIHSTFGISVGYSDHTLGTEVAIAAVALGASVIEKHFTLDRNLPGPDHKASIEPLELKAMISAIRNIEVALGDGIKRLMPGEIKNKAVVRKSIVAKKDIKVGDIFSLENLTIKRPGNGISPMRWDEILGSAASRNYSIDELIEL